MKAFHVSAVLAAALLGVELFAQAPAASQPAAGGPAAPPVYTPVRWNENYTHLKNAETSADPFDSLKYIQLNDEGDWYLSLGGQARYRYEIFNEVNWGAGPQDGNGFHLARFLGHVDAHMGDNVRAFVQMKSSFADDRELDPRPVIDEDDFDFEQAFADFILPLDDYKLMLRGGRQNLLYGAQRLISPLDWTNTRRTFDGGKASLAWPKASNTLDIFWVHPVVVDEGPLNRADDNQNFFGAYDVLSLPNFIENANTKLDLYALGLKKHAASFQEGAGQEDRATLGARLSSNPKPWDFDVEAAYQFGEFASDGDISAWMLATDVGYTLADCPATPRMSLGFDVASGDDDPTDDDLETFNQLFPLGHAYFGYIDAIGRQNIIDLHPGLRLKLTKDVTFSADYHLFWRYSEDDAVYTVNGSIVRADRSALGADLSDTKFIGSEIDLLLNWQIDRHLSTYVGYSHFFAGDFIDDTASANGGADEDIDFFYMAAVFTF